MGHWKSHGASAPILALFASRAGEPPLSAMSWARVSSRAGGSGVTEESAGPVGGDAPPVVDADTEGDDDPTQTFVNVDGVEPAVTDPWQALESLTSPPAALALSSPGGRGLAPREEKTPQGGSPSNLLDVNRTTQFGASSIYEYDANTPIGGPLEDSFTPVVIPNPGGAGQGSFPIPATLQTPGRAGNQNARADMEATPRLSARLDQARATSAPVTTGAPHAPFLGINRSAAAHAPRGPAHMGLVRDALPAGNPDVGLARIDGDPQPLQPNALAHGPPRRGPLAGTPGEYHGPGAPDTGDQVPAEGGRGTPSH